ncbi:unnamed protein product, partial [Ectocarpus sp. 12 AP-2014]
GVVPASRVPRIRPRGLVWCMDVKALGPGEVDLTCVRSLQLTATACENPLPDGFELPASLEHLMSLEHLEYATVFNHPIAGVKWPLSLQMLKIDWCIDDSIAGVKWPAFHKQLELGGGVDQPIDGVEWPASLLQIQFGMTFD